jgi:hypothetical protein
VYRTKDWNKEWFYDKHQNSRGTSTQKYTTIKNSTFGADPNAANSEGCSAANNGGAIWTRATTEVKLENLTIQNAIAANNGGGIYLDTGVTNATLTGGSITGCQAVSGSAVYVGNKASFIIIGFTADNTCFFKGVQKHSLTDTLNTEFTLFTCLSLTFFFTVNIGNIYMGYSVFRDRRLEEFSYKKACRVTVRQDYYPFFTCKTAKELLLFFILEYTEAVSFNNKTVNYSAELYNIVLAFYNYGFINSDHIFSPFDTRKSLTISCSRTIVSLS